jgi:hypothetical protein
MIVILVCMLLYTGKGLMFGVLLKGLINVDGEETSGVIMVNNA